MRSIRRPIFLQDLTHGTLSNTEQQDLHFVKHTLSQWIKAWEQECNLKLFGPRNRARFVEFNVDGLLRGDFRTRMEGYAKAIQNAINTPDEVRAMENWPRKGGDADKLHIQGATVPLGDQLKRGMTAPSPPAENDNDRADREIRLAAGLAVEERKGTNAPMLAGYAAVFDVETDIAGFFRERSRPAPSPMRSPRPGRCPCAVQS